ncbi:hypothetical protein [Allokutzneria sp. NRRL B-24872]|uniref:hypothetical protein n=1 Tax=Allokutzneria sp. NRRL B-24872 TaxID=1137961 RepID=UPI000A380891|nr:hypothetical protein [Allokutzneria sp. NRRL B-24872]
MTDRTIRELGERLVELGMVARDKADSVFDDSKAHVDEAADVQDLLDALVEFGLAFSVHGDVGVSVEGYYRELLQDEVGPLTGVAFSDVVLLREEDGHEMLHFARDGKSFWWLVEHEYDDYTDQLAFFENVADLEPGGEDPRGFHPYSPKEGESSETNFYVLATHGQALALQEEFGLTFALSDADSGPPRPVTVPFLDTWLPQRDRVLAEWRARFLPADFPFDFSLDSLDALEPFVLDRYDSSAAVRTPEDEFAAGAVRYVGETLLRNTPGKWEYREHGDSIYSRVPLIKGDVPIGFFAVSVPLHALASLAAKRVPGTLRRQADHLQEAAARYARARGIVEARRS